jgi:hypothetical protein
MGCRVKPGNDEVEIRGAIRPEKFSKTQDFQGSHSQECRDGNTRHFFFSGNRAAHHSCGECGRIMLNLWPLSRPIEGIHKFATVGFRASRSAKYE